MPEGPEIYLTSCYINEVCKNRIFEGSVEKSDVNKNPDIPWNCKYRISATSRGKELKLSLIHVKNVKKLNILMRFGMTGSFKFTDADSLPKHSHLRFYTSNKKSPKVLSFVDPRRFGKWEISDEWSSDRGPDPMFQYEDFRKNVLLNLSQSIFSKPICEVLLNQKYFNGIGNYLRAEILYRAQIPPFDEARTVLETLNISEDNAEDDILHLCKIIPLEVVNLHGNKYLEDSEDFYSWLRCYENKNMNTMKDSNNRTIWFSGEPGLLASRLRDKRKNSTKSNKVTETKNHKKRSRK
ncbi:endonuclease 8-like 1 isoform X1 [Centruroides sculpturatus]|uniref:endonuclease 8-like 1 isoform X1 n=1 Tax=Centruroides sculpturatus TaxID=218467 RepID=UPI000C6EA186|nr:endonuclease 8-like 1 isoform X1 [Centruroides sculpturatus]